MRDVNLPLAAVWATRAALAGAMFVVEDPLRLSAAVLLLAMQIPIQARLQAYASRASGQEWGLRVVTGASASAGGGGT